MSEVRACYFCGDENVINNPCHYTAVCQEHEPWGTVFLPEIFVLQENLRQKRHGVERGDHFCAICGEKLSLLDFSSIDPFRDFNITCLKHRHVARFYQIDIFIDLFNIGKLPATLWSIHKELGIKRPKKFKKIAYEK